MESDKEAQKDNKPVIPFEDSHISTVFNNDSEYVFIYKKTERIVAAIYMVSDLLSDSEPIKWNLRKLSLSLLSLCLTLPGTPKESREKILNDFKRSAAEIISLCGAANITGMISVMNYSILSNELSGLVNLAESKENSGLTGAKIPTDFFSVPEVEFPKDKDFISQNIKDSIKSNVLNKSVSISNVLEARIKQKSDQSIKDNSQDSIKRSVVEIKRNKRLSIIINLLKRKKEITIKDVSDVIADCSEKTLQRELLALVKEGVLKKEGERRWSRYSLS